jgi:hypothetical protein
MYVAKFPNVFNVPDEKATIWRYMDLAKFISMLEKRALFFCRSDLFDDRFEGSYPKGSAIEAAIADALVPADRTGWANQMVTGRRQLREAVLVNCWHINEHESAAVWKLYLQSDKGIAIKSTVQRLIDAVKCAEEVWIGAVQYRDYDVAALPSPNVYEPFVSKRKSFEHERELRAVIFDEERWAGVAGTWPVVKSDRGTLASTDLDRLIEEVRILPGAPSYFRDSLVSLFNKYCLAKDVNQSSLDDTPLY